MIRGDYWYHDDTRADLIRPLNTLPRRDGLIIVIVLRTDKVYEAYLDVTLAAITIRSEHHRKITDIVGWFPR